MKLKLKHLKAFILEVEKKYKKSASEMRIEIHRPEQHRGDILWIPHELDYLGVATYPKDEDYPKETVVVMR